MIINEKILESGITSRLAADLLEQHEAELPRLTKLHDYYLGRHDILNRLRASEGTANNRVVCNHAKYIVDMAQSYLTGNKISYACSEGYDIEAVKNSYEEQDIAYTDSELSKTVNIYGRAYELIYADEDSHPRSAVLQPENAFVVYAQSVAERPLLGVYYYKTFDMQGRCTGVVCNVYDSSYLYRFEAGQDSYRSLVLSGTERHYFKAVPLIEYRNNAERQGDFEQLIPLIDAYNLLCSDRVNDKEQFVDAFLFLSGIEIDSAQAKKLKAERILMGYDGSDARYLSKVMSESDIKVLRDDLKDDIHRFSMVPDLSDESFGNNLSGVAIKYKLLGFEQAVKNKERLFAKGLKRRFELYNRYLAMLSKMSEVPVHRVEITFTYNLPANELEIAQMISLLTGTVSSETLLERLPFVSDAKEEAELAAEEKTESYRRRLESTQGLAEGGGY